MNFRQRALLFFCGLLISIGCLSARAQADQFIEDVQIAGNRRMTSEEVLSHLKIRPGQLFNQRQIENDFKTLLSLGVYNPSNTRVLMELGRGGGICVIFEVMELPLIKSVVFTGLPKDIEKEIRQLLQHKQYNIREGRPANIVKLRQANEIIKNFLSKKGWSNTNAYFSYSDISAREVLISFVVIEQHPVRYLKID